MTDFSPAFHRFGDVAVRLSVELGRADMPLKDVLSLGQGSVVTLSRLTDELLDVTANGKVVAQGEVIAEDGKFALRIVTLAGDEVADPSQSAQDVSDQGPAPDAIQPGAGVEPKAQPTDPVAPASFDEGEGL